MAKASGERVLSLDRPPVKAAGIGAVNA